MEVVNSAALNDSPTAQNDKASPEANLSDKPCINANASQPSLSTAAAPIVERGFILEKSEYVPEVGGEVRIYRHVRLGAQSGTPTFFTKHNY